METQLICFIDPFKFSTLLSRECEERIKFPQNQNNLLGYIDQDGKIEFFDFEINRANKASIILVPDLFPLEEDYNPERDFMVLIHSHTSRTQRLNPLKIKQFYKGFKMQLEQKGTIYEFIANMLEQNNLNHNN